MIEFLKMNIGDQKDSYRIVSNDLGMSEAIVEKDYWIVFMLYILFYQSRFKNVFAFKGGTSLSKAYHKIQRFSEDIDLVLDWRVLGYGQNEPWENRSKTQQRKFNIEANERAAIWISEKLKPELKGIFQNLGVCNIQFSIALEDAQTVLILYPNIYKDRSILQEVRLEIGPLAAWTPLKNKKISAFVMDEFPDLFEDQSIRIPTVEAKRTFWEKVTILHKEAHRVRNKTPLRYSRHYYDVYRLALSDVKSQAFDDLTLLKHVVDFKMKFYADNSAKYEDAIPGKVQLLPNIGQLEGLKKDYQSMQNMMFGESPDFDSLLVELEKLEREINELRK